MVGRYSRNPAFVNAIRLLIGVPHDDVLGRHEELSARIRSDYELWAQVIRTAGVKLE